MKCDKCGATWSADVKECPICPTMPKTNIEEKVAFERIRGEVTRQSKVRNWNVPEGELDYVVSEAIKDAMEESRTLALKEAEEAVESYFEAHRRLKLERKGLLDGGEKDSTP